MVKSLRLFQPKRIIKPKSREVRGSRHERGYDAEWVSRTEGFRAEHPLCQECLHHGRMTPLDVVDHKIPVRDRPDLRLVRSNWWSLCHTCHNGIKARMERLARALGMIDLLPIWCDEPPTRPPELQERRRRDTPEMQI